MIKFLILLPFILCLFIRDKWQSRGEPPHLYGIYGFFGLPGAGKTMAMSYKLKQLREKYGDDIYICTNYAYNDQDFEFTSWKQLLLNYDKPLIVAWDEVQNEFNSRDFKSFPVSLLVKLTQVRKGNGIQILYTAQRWHFVDKNFRSLSFGCYDCHTHLGRYTTAKLYDPEDYDQLCSEVNVEKKMKVRRKGCISFIQKDALRNCYDSYQMLITAKSKEYLDRDEVARLEAVVK